MDYKFKPFLAFVAPPDSWRYRVNGAPANGFPANGVPANSATPLLFYLHLRNNREDVSKSSEAAAFIVVPTNCRRYCRLY